MRKVAIIGIGIDPVGEHWDASIRMIAAEAVQTALDDAGVKAVDALYVGNAYGASFSSQSQLGALIADYAGLGGIERSRPRQVMLRAARRFAQAISRLPQAQSRRRSSSASKNRRIRSAPRMSAHAMSALMLTTKRFTALPSPP